MKKHFLCFVIILFLQITGCGQGGKDIIKPDRSVIVAIVGGDTLTLHDFKKFIQQDKYKRVDLSAAMERHRILNELVNHHLILKNVENIVLEGIDSVDRILKNVEEERLAGRIIRTKIIYPNIPEDDLRSFYDKLRIEMNVRHLFVFHNENQKIKIRSSEVPYRNRKRAKEIADSLYAIVKKNPGAMTEVIETASDDQETKYRKGEIGFIHYDKFDPLFRETIFNLKNSEISSVIESPDGFHIFQKTGHRVTTLIEPYEQLRPSILASYAHRYDERPTRKMAEDYQRFIDSLLGAYQLSFNEKNIGLFLDRYRKIKAPADILTIFPLGERGKNLAQFEGGYISVHELVNAMASNRTKVKLDAERMKQGLRNIATTRILAAEARKQNVQLSTADQDDILDMKRTMLKDIVTYRNVEAPIVMNNKTVEEFYSQNLQHYREPDKVSFLELFAADKNLIDLYAAEVKTGKDFRKVAKKAESVQGNRFGESGLIPVEKKNELTLHAWKMEHGEISEPFTWSGGGYSIIQLLEKKPGRQLSFKESEEKAGRDFYQYQKKNNMSLWLAKLKGLYPVQTFESNLNEIYDIIRK